VLKSNISWPRILGKKFAWLNFLFGSPSFACTNFVVTSNTKTILCQICTRWIKNHADFQMCHIEIRIHIEINDTFHVDTVFNTLPIKESNIKHCVMETCGECVHNLGTKGRCVVNFISQQLYTGERLCGT
jgi:hypothetical protein